MMDRQPAIGFRMVWAGGLLMLALGCETMSLRPRSDDGHVLPAPTGAGLVATDRPRIADVPMPIGFVVVPSRSHSLVPPSGPRVVTHVYQGASNVAEVSSFYRQQTPTQGWQTIGERSDGSITTMAYVKGQEELTIQISHPRVVDVVITIRDRNTTAPAAVKP